MRPLRPFKKFRRSHRPQKGAALVMTLIILVILSILVTGFVTSMRTEMAASYSNENIQRTKMIAQGAVSHGIDLLRSNIPEPARIGTAVSPADVQAEPQGGGSLPRAPFAVNVRGSLPSSAISQGANWIVNPGRLTIVRQDYDGRRARSTVEQVPLHTGEAESDPRSDPFLNAKAVNLNEPLPGDELPPIALAQDSDGNPDPDADHPEMWVKWVNLFEDPTQPPGADNRIIGRYAFWMDDECGKINYNTAIGKPAPREQDDFDLQLHGVQSGADKRLPMLTPQFRRGNARQLNDSSATLSIRDNTLWALGHPGSVNLDVLLDYGEYDKSNLNDEALLEHIFNHGFHRYPEAIVDYIDVDRNRRTTGEELLWYQRNRYNLTHYSRAPEFNVFGFSRLFTTNIPISLEGGPLYQLPFAYEYQGGNRFMHLHSLMGNFGFTDRIDYNPDDPNATARSNILAGNVVNRLQMDTLFRYLTRPFPAWTNHGGTEYSFADKYGSSECLQICQNIICKARVGTTTMNETNEEAFNRAWAYRNTSTNYAPERFEDVGATPEKHYWEFNGRGVPSDPLLPQMGGPHIMEVQVEFNRVGPLNPEMDEYKINYKFGLEYYMHPYGPIVTYVRRNDLLGGGNKNMFAFMGRVDLLKIDVTDSEGTPVSVNIIGDDGKWDDRNSTEKLRIGMTVDPEVAGSQILGPAGSRLYKRDGYGQATNTQDPRDIVNRAMVWSNPFWIRNTTADPAGEHQPIKWGTPASPGSITLDFGVRLGMSTGHATNRPKQMIPRSTVPSDVLKPPSPVTWDRDGPDKLTFAWEINDPRISSKVAYWQADNGNADGTATGSPAGGVPVDGGGFDPDDGLNASVGEPSEYSSEKSKFRVLHRALNGSVVYPSSSRYRDEEALARGDEYSTNSRTVSPAYWSLLHMGIINGSSWKTLSLEASDEPSQSKSGSSSPNAREQAVPDWLLLDLFGATYPMQRDQWRRSQTGPDEFSTISYMNSTMGKINLNSRVYPRRFFDADQLERRKPLEAVFTHLRSEASIRRLLDGISDYQEDDEWFDYIGELAEVDDYDNTTGLPWDDHQFEKEALLRNMAGCLTTNSNTFGMWGVAQTIKKASSNSTFDEVEVGDNILGEKRFFAIIERYIWPGKDGLPGNAHLDTAGRWDRKADDSLTGSVNPNARTNTLFGLPGSPPLRGNTSLIEFNLALDKVNGVYPLLDGPEEVSFDSYTERTLGKIEWERSSLEDAFNPPQPVIKYRVAYFRFLDS